MEDWRVGFSLLEKPPGSVVVHSSRFGRRTHGLGDIVGSMV